MNKVKTIHSVLKEYPLLGWAAFGVAIVCFLIFLAWGYKKEANLAKRAMIAMAAGGKANSETSPLIEHKKNAPWIDKTSSKFHKICSDDEVTDGGTPQRSSRDYAYPQYRDPSRYETKPNIPYFSRTQSKNQIRNGWHREAFKQIYPSSDMSSADSDSSRIMMNRGAPLSYREMKKNSAANSPIILPAFSSV